MALFKFFQKKRQLTYYILLGIGFALLGIGFASSCRDSQPSHNEPLPLHNEPLHSSDNWKNPEEIASTNKPAKVLFVFLHGTTMNGKKHRDSKVINDMQQKFPDWHFMLPNGAYPADATLCRVMGTEFQHDPSKRQFVSLKCIESIMRKVYDKPSLSIEKWETLYKQNKSSFNEMSTELERESRPLMELIKKKQKILNLTNKDTIIAGYSQGAMLGLHLTLTQKEPFLGMVNFSGFLVEPKEYKNNATPIYFINGTLDKIIPIATLETAKEQLAKKGIKPVFEKLDGQDHVVYLSNNLEKWLRQLRYTLPRRNHRGRA
ncbi:alpha/beta hydrolase [Candidatus Cardinium hertigii]|uniref:Phospholipase/carboxylesterase/thioesterase domain-containing protein n=1 Tax=Candidatus Cardinium hertigii TaxID=247481 RepID=A0A3N2QCT0_9BACT|nr:dienelactone hydrolase family protein [Candidatus Cardinium hertigii]ROT47604.1 hypothetical protein EDM02_01370 [Candidatus Cardinium hertigii]ROT47710.1 hypothetical protein EDM02_00865 [Candidatus Cardinium hertigii]